MSKELHCKDLMPDCSYVAKGTSDDDVLRQAAEHARTAHDIREMTPELEAKVRSAIREA